MTLQYGSEVPAYNPQQAQSGIWENFKYGAQVTLESDLPLVSRMISSETENILRGQIHSRIEKGELDKGTFHSFMKDIPAYLEYMERAHPEAQLPTLKEYRDRVKSEWQANVQEEQQTYQRAGFIGKAANFTGKVAASLADPIYWPAMAVGVGEAASALTVAGRFAATEMVTQAVAQPMIADVKQQYDMKYDASDMLVNGAAAVAGSAILGSAPVAIGKVKDWVMSTTAKRNMKKIGQEAELENLRSTVDTLTTADGSDREAAQVFRDFQKSNELREGAPMQKRPETAQEPNMPEQTVNRHQELEKQFDQTPDIPEEIAETVTKSREVSDVLNQLAEACGIGGK